MSLEQILANGVDTPTTRAHVDLVVHDIECAKVQPISQPAFSAYLTATAANATGSNATYTLASLTKLFDNASELNATSGVFTASQDGKYRLDVQVGLQAEVKATGITLAMVAAGVTYNNTFTRSAAQTTTAQALSLSVFVDFLEGQTAVVTCAVTGEDANTVGITGGSPVKTFFSGHLVC